MKTIIYSLSHPITKEVRYVGRTVKTLKERLNGHISQSKRFSTHKNNWIQTLLAENLRPEIAELDHYEGDGYAEEQIWIEILREQGARLTNATDGGNGSLNPSPETKAKLAASGLGRKPTLETRQKISIANKGRKCSQEAKAAMSLAQQGRVHSEETKTKISIRTMEALVNSNTRVRMSETHTGTKNHFYGKLHTNDARKKMSERGRQLVCFMGHDLSIYRRYGSSGSTYCKECRRLNAQKRRNENKHGWT